MTEKVRGATRPTILRHLLPIVAVLLLAAVLVAPVAAVECSYHSVALTSAGGTLASGTYYLKEDVTLTNNLLISGENTKVTLCLNGKTLNGTGTGSVIIVQNGATLYIYDCESTGKITGGNEIQNNGGGLRIIGGSTVIMNGGNITNNTVTYTTPGFGHGGGVYVSGSTFEIHGGTIHGNKATDGHGGGIVAENSAKIEITSGSVIKNNSIITSTSWVYGAGIYVSSSTLTMTDSEIYGNSGPYRGGGIYASGTDTDVTLTNCNIYENHLVNSWGGGIYGDYGGKIVLVNSRIYNNTAAGYGGGIGLERKATVTMSSSSIYGNKLTGGSGSSGGGVYMQRGAKFEMDEGSSIHDNTAPSTAGVVMGTASKDGSIAEFRMNGGSIKNNKANGYGSGGVSVEGYSHFIINNGEISGNGGGQLGNAGGIHATGNLTLSGRVIIKDNYVGQTNNAESVRNLQMSPDKTFVNGLAAGSEIGVSLVKDNYYQYPTLASPITISTSYLRGATDYGQYFFSDSEPKKYAVDEIEDTANPGHVKLALVLKSYPINLDEEMENGTVIVKTEARNTETVTVTAAPDEGFTYDSSTQITITKEDGTNVATVDSGSTFTMPAAPVTVTAKFTANTYTINTGTIPSGKLTETTAKTREQVTVTVTPDLGYAVSTITAKTVGGKDIEVTTNSETGTGTFTMPADNVLISAEFTKVPLALTIDSTIQNGTIALSTSSANVGDTITVTATPETDYALEKITIKYNDGTEKTETVGTTFTMPGYPVTVGAVFLKDLYKITTTANPANGGEITGVTGAKAGVSVTLTAVPATGYKLKEFTSVGVTGTTTDNTFQFTMQSSDVSVTAYFIEEEYAIATGTSTGGSITNVLVNGADIDKANYTDEVTVEISENSGYEFVSLTITETDNSGNSFVVTGKTFRMPAYKVTITATFAEKKYAIDVSHKVNGTIVASPVSAVKDATVVLKTESIKEGYTFLKFNITGDDDFSGEVTSNPGTFTMPDENVTVVLEVEPIYYTITENTEKATLTLSKNVAIVDDTITVTAAADSGYVVNQIQVLKEDGSIHATISGTSGSFKMPASDIIIKTVGTIPSSSSPSGDSSGSSVWLMETQTPTPTPTVTPTETETVPTDFPSTQPTDVESPGFGVLAVMAGLGAVAVLRRR